MTLSETIELISKATEGVTHPDAPEWISVAQDGNGPNGGFWTCAAATTESPRYIRADLVHKIQEELALARSVHRWNVDRYGENLAVCRNEHDKGDPCDWETFVPLARAEAAAREAEALKREIAEKDARIAALEAGISDLVEIARQGVPSIPPDGPTTPEHQAAYEATGFTFVEIRSRARALLSKESDDAGGSTITTSGDQL